MVLFLFVRASLGFRHMQYIAGGKKDLHSFLLELVKVVTRPTVSVVTWSLTGNIHMPPAMRGSYFKCVFLPV